MSEKKLLQAAEPLLTWYESHARILPWREDSSPYRVWVSEIMLQQTRVEAVKPYFERFEPLLTWYESHARILPWREDSSPYRVWVSEIMLQQTRVEAVKPYFERFIRELPTISDLADASEDKILKLWEGLGYYNRVRNMQKAAQILKEESGGERPEDYEAIHSLPGIGSYTAGAVSSIAFGMKYPAVDGNVLRVLQRIMK